MTENYGELKLADELKLQKEIESVEFYIAQGYKDLANKTLYALEEQYGNRPEFEELRLQMDDSLQKLAFDRNLSNKPEINAYRKQQQSLPKPKLTRSSDLKNEFGFEDSKSQTEDDYETHYHTAVAYQEMGLMEEAIREFQDAINLISTDDGTRRFFPMFKSVRTLFYGKKDAESRADVVQTLFGS